LPDLVGAELLHAELAELGAFEKETGNQRSRPSPMRL